MRNLLILFVLLQLAACDEPAEKETSSSTDSTGLETPDWTDATHGNDTDPNYTEVFPQDQVNRIDINLTSANWSAIQTNMQSLFGFAFGAGGGQGGGFPDEETDYVAVSVFMNDTEWYEVGFRLKGNSTLAQAWASGIYKLPFRLNFDKFEDTCPEIKNQRFYGFKELTFSPGAKDNSLLREKIGADIFRRAGIPAAQTAFYRVYINFGDGLKYCGVYTVVEVVDDSMIETQFGEDDGNIYKPESYLKTFSVAEFEKKNNEDLADYSDVQAFITALNSSTRTTDAAQWRVQLEATFHVDHFLKWLAINTTMTNWDTYSAMAHNYYLYNHPANKLTWIPWDNNECLASRSGPGGNSVNLSLSTVTSAWPLIRYLADDPVYYAQYKTYVRTFTDEAFAVADMQELLTTYHNLIAPYVIGPGETESGKYTQLSSSAAFTSELTTLKQYIVTRHSAVESFLP